MLSSVCRMGMITSFVSANKKSKAKKAFLVLRNGTVNKVSVFLKVLN
jgi:hypothetical protein